MRNKNKVFGLIMLLMVLCTMFFVAPNIKKVEAETLTGQESETYYADATTGRIRYEKALKGDTSEILTGDIVNLVVLFKFKGEKVESTMKYGGANIDVALNNTLNNAPLSVKEYFKQVSLGKVNYHSFFVANKTNYFIAEAPEERGFYLKYDRTNNPEGYMPGAKETRKVGLIRNVINQVNAFYNENLQNLTDDQLRYFNSLDSNGDGFIDSITLLYLNYGSNYSEVSATGDVGWEDLLWPQNSSAGGAVINGCELASYSLMPQDRILTTDTTLQTTIEGYGTIGNVSTICHETAHMFGMPDLYSYMENEAEDAVSGWDIMSANHAPNPQYINSYLRYAAGWLDDSNFEEIKYNGTYSLNPVSYAAEIGNLENYHNPVAYYVRGQGDYENQLIVFEYREYLGAFEGNKYTTNYGIPNNGLLIYRVDLGVTPMGGFGSDIFAGNYGNSPYGIYYFRPQTPEGGEGVSANAAFKNGASFGTRTDVINQITFQYYNTSLPQDQILPEGVTYVNTELVVSDINIVDGKISFTIDGGNLINEEDEEPVEIKQGPNGVQDRVLYDALVEITGETTLYNTTLLNTDGLTVLDLSGRGVTNLTGLKLFKLDNITRVILDSNQIDEGYSDLLALKNMTVLQLGNMGLTDEEFTNNYLRNIYDITALTALDLSRNEITDINFINYLTNIATLNVMFNKLPGNLDGYANDLRVFLGVQNVTSLFSIGPYAFNFYYNTRFTGKEIEVSFGNRTDPGTDLDVGISKKVGESTFPRNASTSFFINEFRVNYLADSPFYYADNAYTVRFYAMPVEVDTYLDIRYWSEGVYDGDGITYTNQYFDDYFILDRLVERYAEDGSGEPVQVTGVDMMTVGRYRIFHKYTNSVDPSLTFNIEKWVHVLSNDEITREDMPDVNLYTALLSIVNTSNNSTVSTLHSQDLARIGITEIDLVKADIGELTGMEKMNLENIVKIDVSSNKITSLNPLSNVTSLEILYAKNNLISDLSAIISLVNLEYLDLSFNNISDIQVLKDFVDIPSVNVKCINLVANYIDLNKNENFFAKLNPVFLLLIQGLKQDAHYINSVDYQYHQYEDITHGITVKFKLNNRTQVMTNENYLVSQDALIPITIQGSSNCTFGSFSAVTYSVAVSTFSLAPIVYLEDKFLEGENDLLVGEVIKKPDASDIIRNSKNTSLISQFPSTVSIGYNFSSWESYAEDESFMFFKINNISQFRTENIVTYTVKTCFKNSDIECDAVDITRTIYVYNNRDVTLGDRNLELALLELAGKGNDETVKEYDFYKKTSLDLSGKGIVNLYGISSLKFQNLSVLKLSHNEIDTSGSNSKLTILNTFEDLTLIDLSYNKITNAYGIQSFEPDHELTIVLFLNQLAPCVDNQYCFERINDLPENVKVVTGVQCAESEMSAFNQDVFYYYNPVNVNLISQRFSYGVTGQYDEETYKVYYSTPTPLDNAVFSYVYRTDVNIVFDIKISRGEVSLLNNTMDVEVYSDFVDEELVYEGIPKSEYTITNVKYRKEGQLAKLDYLRNTELATFEQTFTLILNSSNQAFDFIKSINVVDTTKPVVNLIGDEYIYLETGAEYEEFGIMVSDNYYKEVAITKAIPPRGTVNTLEKGVYVLTYYATDGSGNTSDPVQRTVEVDYHDFIRFDIRGGDPLVYVGEATFEAYYMGINTDYLDYLYYDPEPTFYWYVNDVLVHTTKDLVFKYTPETAGRYNVELRINNKIMNETVCSTELLVMFDDEVALYTAIGAGVGAILITGIIIWICIARKKRRELYNEYSNETYRSARRK